MKIAIKAGIFVALSTALAVAQTPQTFGAWSVYKDAGSRPNAHLTLVQTKSLSSSEIGEGTESKAELDIVCQDGKLRGLAVRMNSAVLASAVSLDGAVDTVHVGYTVSGTSGSEQWAVLDNRHTVSPYSEVSQAKSNRSWVNTLVAGHDLVLRLPGRGDDGAQKVSFETNGVAEALASAGCSY